MEPYLPGERALGAAPLNISHAQVRDWIRRLKGMGDEEFLTINKLACEEISGQNKNEEKSPDEMALWWARAEKQEEIAELERYLNPSKIPEEAERRQLWKSLWRAQTVPVLNKVCEQWAGLRDVRLAGLGVFPNHILANADEFLRMKRDRRFPNRLRLQLMNPVSTNYRVAWPGLWPT